MKIINKLEELDKKLINTTNSWTTSENRGSQANFFVVVLMLAAVIGAIISIIE